MSVYRPILAADYCVVFDSNRCVLAIYIYVDQDQVTLDVSFFLMVHQLITFY